MARVQATRNISAGDRKLSSLEAELAKVTEGFRLAKLAAREAKAEAKALKKEMKRARKALIVAQEARDALPPAGGTKKKTVTKSSKPVAAPAKATATRKRKIADSPETVRSPRRKRQRKPSETLVPVPAAAELSTPQPESTQPGATPEPGRAEDSET